MESKRHQNFFHPARRKSLFFSSFDFKMMLFLSKEDRGEAVRGDTTIGFINSCGAVV